MSEIYNNNNNNNNNNNIFFISYNNRKKTIYNGICPIPQKSCVQHQNLIWVFENYCEIDPWPNRENPHGESIKVRLPQNTIVDLRTFSLFYKGTAESSFGGNVHFPRLSSSIIKPVLSSNQSYHQTYISLVYPVLSSKLLAYV